MSSQMNQESQLKWKLDWVITLGNALSVLVLFPMLILLFFASATGLTPSNSSFVMGLYFALIPISIFVSRGAQYLQFKWSARLLSFSIFIIFFALEILPNLWYKFVVFISFV
jgi:hypothetical protein